VTREFDVVLVGGCGHVGLPLGVALASKKLRVALYDISSESVAAVNSGRAPFFEPGLDLMLREVLSESLIVATEDPTVVSRASSVIVIIGTPVDEHQNPEPHKVLDAVQDLVGRMTNDQHLILRSTIYPGTTALIESIISETGLDIPVSFCPERIAEGRAMIELFELPQIVSSRSERGLEQASALFGNLTNKIITMSPEEAEMAKLFTNVWRYIKFAAANQLFMMATNLGLDYESIRRGLMEDYPRASDLPSAGFAAGPCLLKDTLQLAAFNDNNFVLGHAAINVNEGLPLFVVSRLESLYKLSTLKVGILGMAFKGDSDDVRSSLAYKLKRLLRFKAKAVFTSDPYVTVDTELVSADRLLSEVDLVIVGAPHKIYRDLEISMPVVDIWGLFGSSSGL
jgi:UDP-N-acetyl-D-mannosaminuronic acid dehydrogenase